MKRRAVLGAAAALAAGGLGHLPLALGQAAFPSRPIRLVVPFPPGGPTDVFARQYAVALGAALGTSVVVENKAGASGAIGSVDVMRAAPDGHTLLFGTASTHALYNLLVAKPQYDSLKDFAPVAIVGGAPIVFIASPSLPPTLKEIVAQARANPGKYRYGSPGQGTMMHLAAERLKSESGGTDIGHIPFKGSAQAKTALLGDQIELMTDTLGASLADHKAGKLRIVAIAASKRSEIAPDIPTVDEALGTKGFEAVLWNVVLAPAGTPPATMNALAAATAKAMTDPALLESLARLGITPQAGSGPAAATEYIRAEMGRWKSLVDASGIKLE
jgi:tripartite-type tricarboxylate transporter receptor subunit TctC